MKDFATLLEEPIKGTRIESNTSFKGEMEITGEECVVVQGSFEGLIIAKAGKVFIGEGGVVRGSIEADQIVVVGKIESTSDDDAITAGKILAISSSGQVSSPTIGYGAITMELGAVLQGNMKPSAPRSSAHHAVPAPAAAVMESAPTIPANHVPTPAAAPTGGAGSSRVISIDSSRPAIPQSLLRPVDPGDAAASSGSEDAKAETSTPATSLRTGTDDALTPLD